MSNKTFEISLEELFNDKSIRIYDRKVIQHGRGARIHLGFLKEYKVVRLFVKKINEKDYLIYMKVLE